MSSTKAAITTHVLDQTTGLPAAGVKVTLSYEGENSQVLHATTDNDGRIANWSFAASSQASDQGQADTTQYILDVIAQSEAKGWVLTFWTEPYFTQQGKKSFWSKVQLPFITLKDDQRKHWHVPLLLGPFGYTTYRGS